MNCDNCGLPIDNDPDTYHCDVCNKSVHADCMDWATVAGWNAETGNHFDREHARGMNDHELAQCSDGAVRTATITGPADTFFTVPARVSVRGRTVTGHLSIVNPIFKHPGITDPPADVVYQFTADQWRKNADALPSWPATELKP